MVKEVIVLVGIFIFVICLLGFDVICLLVVFDEQGQGLVVLFGGFVNYDIIMWMDYCVIVEMVQINVMKDFVLCYVGGEVSVEMELLKLCWLKMYLL